MNYELAKQLKDAGFRQKEHGTLLFAEGTNLAMSQKQMNQRSAYAPTLEELIAACGNTVEDAYFSLSYGRDTWYAMFDMCDYQPLNRLSGDGSTPTEAVAKLWLALMEK